MATESHWRRRARAVIGGAIATARHAGKQTDYEILGAIDLAYPFGPRKYAPYKYWLEERAKAMAAISKNPLMRVCPACGAGLCKLCRDIEGDELKAHRMVLEDARKFYKGQGSPEIMKRLYALEELCVHEARKALVPAAKHDDLPLFEATA